MLQYDPAYLRPVTYESSGLFVMRKEHGKHMTCILRVFPHRTSYTPTDALAFAGEPLGLLIPPHDEVHISCVFTWDNGKRY